MVIGLTCNCHGAPGLFRQFLFENHVHNYMTVPMKRGEEAKAWAEDNSVLDIIAYLNKRSSYVIIVGWSEPDFSDLRWSDINNGDPERRLRAEMILEQFA